MQETGGEKQEGRQGMLCILLFSSPFSHLEKIDYSFLGRLTCGKSHQKTEFPVFPQIRNQIPLDGDTNKPLSRGIS